MLTNTCTAVLYGPDTPATAQIHRTADQSCAPLKHTSVRVSGAPTRRHIEEISAWMRARVGTTENCRACKFPKEFLEILRKPNLCLKMFEGLVGGQKFVGGIPPLQYRKKGYITYRGTHPDHRDRSARLREVPPNRSLKFVRIFRTPVRIFRTCTTNR